MKLIEYLEKQTRGFLIVAGVALIVLLGIIDYLTGPELSFSIFYLLPISLAAWAGGRRVGVLMSVASVASWLAADLLGEHGYSHFLVPYWNAAVRFSFFIVVTYTLAALRASRERQEELGQFIVHDLRSPLGNVVAGLQLLQDTARETVGEDERNLIKICLLSCDKMLILINSLLDLRRLEAGRMPLQYRPTDVKELVEHSLRLVALQAERSQITLTFQQELDVLTVHTDPDVTTRVLVNLLSNALKFSPAGSTVTICAVRAEGNAVALSVTDQGPGIAKQWVGRAFDKFVQVEAARVGSKSGSGLGLAFCRLAIEAQGGRIWLESMPGKGTTVTFTLLAAS